MPQETMLCIRFWWYRKIWHLASKTQYFPIP